MPQAVALALIGAGMYAGYRLAQAWTAQNRDAASQARATDGSADRKAMRDLGDLEPDPQTGIYRPRHH